jgi:hypothetical protein
MLAVESKIDHRPGLQTLTRLLKKGSVYGFQFKNVSTRHQGQLVHQDGGGEVVDQGKGPHLHRGRLANLGCLGALRALRVRRRLHQLPIVRVSVCRHLALQKGPVFGYWFVVVVVEWTGGARSRIVVQRYVIDGQNEQGFRMVEPNASMQNVGLDGDTQQSVYGIGSIRCDDELIRDLVWLRGRVADTRNANLL